MLELARDLGLWFLPLVETEVSLKNVLKTDGPYLALSLRSCEKEHQAVAKLEELQRRVPSSFLTFCHLGKFQSKKNLFFKSFGLKYFFCF